MADKPKNRVDMEKGRQVHGQTRARFASNPALGQTTIRAVAKLLEDLHNAADKFVTDGGHGAFEQVTYSITVRSNAPPERVRLLIEHAERACHAAQSLRQPVPVSLEVQMNGRPLPLAAE